MSLEQFLKYKTPRQTTEFLIKFWERRYRNFESYLDKLFSVSVANLEELFE